MAFKNTRLYDPRASTPFKLSRSKIDLFGDCKRCFYLDRKIGVSRPSIPAFTLNTAVDHLLKKEFDIHRKNKSKHPIMESYGVDAVPFDNEKLNDWRENFVGIQFLHKPTNLLIFGAVDDIWINNKKELIVVDYKATSKNDAVTELEDSKWHNQYRRQIEIYQWLLKNNDFKVSDTGYFVYVNGKKDVDSFDKKLEFDVNLIAHEGDTTWIEPTILEIKKCLDSEELPKSSISCEYCNYAKSYAKNVADKIRKSNKTS